MLADSGMLVGCLPACKLSHEAPAVLHCFSCVHALLQVFSVYECRSAAAQHGKEHPGDIAEPASLAAIPLPSRCSGCWLGI